MTKLVQEHLAMDLAQLTALPGAGTNPIERLIELNARGAHLALQGAASAASAGVSAQGTGGTVVRAFWWGFHIEISHRDLQSFLNSAAPINSVIGALGGGIPSPAAPFIALAAAFIAGALELLRGLDRGRGVYVSMSWFAPGVFIPTTVTGPASLSSAVNALETRPLGEPYEQAGVPFIKDYNGGPFGTRMEEDILWNLPVGTVRDEVVVNLNPPGFGNIHFSRWLSPDPSVGHFRLHVGIPWWVSGRVELRMMIRDRLSPSHASTSAEPGGPRPFTADELKLPPAASTS